MSASVVAVEGVCLTIEVTVGAKVSPVIVSVLLAMLLSEVAFVNVFAATDIVEDRLWVFVVGVNIDVNTFKSPVAVMEDREPPLIVMSLSVKFVGTSLKVRVRFAVSPDFTVALSLVMVRVGLLLTVTLIASSYVLPAASVVFTLTDFAPTAREDGVLACRFAPLIVKLALSVSPVPATMA